MKRILVTAALSLTLLTGCDTIRAMAEGTLSVDEQQQLELYKGQIASLEDQIELIEMQAEAQTKAAYEDARKGLTQNMGIRIGQLLELQEQHEQLIRNYRVAVESERAIVAGGAQKVVGGVLTWLGPMIPAPVQPLLPFASSLAVMLFSSRARKHTGKALKATLKGSLGEAAGFILRAVGAAHSSTQTKLVADLEEKGDTVVVQPEAAQDTAS